MYNEQSYAEYLEYVSREHNYIRDITDNVNDVIARGTHNTGLTSGQVDIYSLHTTFGLFIGERGEEGLPGDLINHSLRLIPQDRRSKIGQNPRYPFPKTTEAGDYGHDCSKNKYIPEGNVDLGFNSAEHTRFQLFTSAQVRRPFVSNRMVLGTFQGIHVWELDGRSDAERSGNEEADESTGRVRRLLVCVNPMQVYGLNTTRIDQ